MLRPSSAVTLLALLALLVAGCFEAKREPDLAVIDQDINESESEPADRAIQVLLAQDNVDMVLCRRNDLYEVHSRMGRISFRRARGPAGYRYELVRHEGLNPLDRQDPAALPDRPSELAAGDNPLGTDYRQQDPGYSGPEDRRISFLKAERASYPLAYERIAAVFDGANAGDLIVEFTPWGYFPMGSHDGLPAPGAHGFLNVVSSRAPLVIAGRGARRQQLPDRWARSVDIAPTVARAMGIQKTYGVDERGQLGHDVYLKWQDGHVLEEALDGNTPTHVVILVNDALTNSELRYQLDRGEPLPTYRWLLANGTHYGLGAIVNYPSNTFASQNTIGSGAWSGHHGLIDNWFYDRKEGKRHDPLTEVFDTGKFIVDEVETLHDAVHRSFKNWHPESYPLGNFTISINNPSAKGADHALLESIHPVDWTKCPEPTDFKLPALEKGISARAQAADNLAVNIFAKAFLGSYELEGRKVRCSQPPRYVIVNLALTDDVSHENGPHSDGILRALRQTDQRQQLIFDVLKRAGLFEQTLFVFTSDHGQTMQDVQRVRDFQPALKTAGVRFVATNQFIYLRTFNVKLSQTRFRAGDETALDVEVLDDDTGKPVADAGVKVESGGAAVGSGVTNAEGRAQIRFTPGADQVKITVKDGETVPEELRRTDFVRSY